MGEKKVRRKLERIALSKGYKRLERASKESELWYVVEQMMKYKKKDEIMRELFGDKFTTDAIVEADSKLQQSLLEASLEIICATDDEKAYGRMHTFVRNYEDAVKSVTDCVKKVARYSRDGKTIRDVLRLATTYFYNLSYVMGDISRFNFYGDHEQCARHLSGVAKVYKNAIDDCKESVPRYGWIPTPNHGFKEESKKELPWYTRAWNYIFKKD
ncbi:HET domain-containing protein [Candidatus Woesearchaeota archaeon]|nr:HET domain-containing protein [Candidatus Woesearchaeota archaeon]